MSATIINKVPRMLNEMIYGQLNNFQAKNPLKIILKLQ